MSASLISIDGSTAPIDWTLSVDDEGQRDYQLTWQVQTTSNADGPDIALTCAGLPTPGSSLAIGNTVDPWAFYQRKGNARLHDKSKSAKLWDVTLSFSTRPIQRCSDSSITDPLLEPHKVRGGHNKFTTKVVTDYSGASMVTTGDEPIAIERDDNRPTIQLEMNVAWINIGLVSQYTDAVNNDVWWGQAVRTIKCTDFQWERILYGTCNYYYHVVFQFEFKYDTWDVIVKNYGTQKKVTGSSPARYTDCLDEYGNRVGSWLDINGAQTITPTYFDQTSGTLAKKRVYRELAFSSVGWPAVLL